MQRAAITLRLVIVDQAGRQRLARHHLQLRIKRRTDRETALVQLLLTVALEDLAPHFLGEVFAGEHVRSILLASRDQRLLARLVGVGLLDPAVFHEAIDDVVAALDRALAVAHRVQRRRRLRQCREIGRFRDAQFVDRLVEIDERGGADAVRAKAEENFVEIQFEDAVL
jgi:hypothetical protein